MRRTRGRRANVGPRGQRSVESLGGPGRGAGGPGAGTAVGFAAPPGVPDIGDIALVTALSWVDVFARCTHFFPAGAPGSLVRGPVLPAFDARDRPDGGNAGLMHPEGITNAGRP